VKYTFPSFSISTMRTSAKLASGPLWRSRSENLSNDQRVRRSYERAKSVVDLYRNKLSSLVTTVTDCISELTADDILDVSSRYWEFQWVIRLKLFHRLC